jgi:2-polyprenyl-3-methyl-5-hydroxy-6-metoxy-1,4-benzoquinol methylase
LKQIKGKFDVITALMVFPYMKDFESCIPLFSELLNERGLLIFSVYNPDFVENCISSNVGFRSLRRSGKTTITSMEIEKDLSIETYVRQKDYYRGVFEKHGFEYMSTRFPPFTPEFVAEHGWTLPTDNAEYLIMSLRKRA